MAKGMVTLTLTVNKEQAQQKIEEMKVSLKGMEDELSVVQNKLNDPKSWGDGETYQSLKALEKKLSKQIKIQREDIKRGVQEIEGYEQKLARISELSYNELTKMRTAFSNSIKGLTQTEGKNLEAYQEKLENLQKILDEIEKRNFDTKTDMTLQRAGDVLAKPEDASTKDIEKAISVMTKYRNSMQAGSEEWNAWNGLVQNGTKFLDEFNQKVKTTDMKALQEKVADSTISDADLKVVSRYWEAMIEGADKTNKELDLYKQNLEDAKKLQVARLQEKGEATAKAVLEGEMGASIAEKQEHLKLMQEYRNTISSTSPEKLEQVDKAIGKITTSIKESQPGFMSFEEAMKKAVDIKNFKGNIDELEKIKRTIQEGTTGLKLSGKQLETLKEAQLRLDDIADKYKEIQHLNAPKKIAAVSKALKTDEGVATLSAGELEEAIRLAKELQKEQGTTGKKYEELAVFIANAEAQQKKWNDSAKMTVMTRQFQHLADLSKNALEEQKKYWQGVFDNAEKGSKAYKNAEKKLEAINKRVLIRQKQDAESVIKEVNKEGKLGDSTNEMQSRLKLLQEYRAVMDGTKPNAYKAIDEAIASLNKGLKESQAGFMSFDEALKKSKEIANGAFDGTVDDLERIKKALTEGMGDKKLDLVGQAELKSAQEGLEIVINKAKELANLRAEDKVNKVKGNISGSSPAEIEESIRLAKELQKVQGVSVDRYKELGAFIGEAEKQLKSWNDEIKQSAMESQLVHVSDLSKLAIEDQKKYWQAMIDGASAGDAALKTYKDNLQKVVDVEKDRLQQSFSKTQAEQFLRGGNVKNTVDGIKQLIEDYTKLRGMMDATDAAGLENLDKVIASLRNQLKQTEAGFMSFDEAMDKAADLGSFDGTLEDLEKIRKIIKDGMEKELSLLDPDDKDRMKEALQLLDDISKKQKEMQQLNLKDVAESTMTEVESGAWDKTIADTQEAVKQLKEYRMLLKTDDVDGLKRVDDVLEKLTQKTKEAEKGFMSYTEAMNKVAEVNNGTFKGTIEDLEKLKKTLEELRKSDVTIGDKKKLKDLDEAIFQVQSKLNDTSQAAVSLDWVLKNIKTANFNQLQMAAKQLEEELKNTAQSADDFSKKSAKLREVETQLKKLNKTWEAQDSLVVRMTKRLATYMAVYGSLSSIISMVKEFASYNIRLSDSMADIQKTTGLVGVELQELGREIERLDSRTSTDELYKIAAAAGQIGLKTQEDILGFVKAANTITVALNELGTEGATSLMKIATLTGEVASYGTEGALMRVGSAINELTASSAATAGPITDFISRVGGIASTADIAISEMAALGAVTDASAQSVEIAGTSMNKFISALLSNTENIAYAANISVKELDGLLKSGQTMEAVVRVLESMQTMERGSQATLLKELGSEGARMNQYVASLVANLDMLKEQLAISRRAFEENVSVINEYNVKQESAAGTLERMKNAFKDAFVNSRAAVGMVSVLENISKLTAKIVDLLSNSWLTTFFVTVLEWGGKLLAWIAEFKPALIAVETAVVRLLVLNVKGWLVGFGTSLSGVVKIINTAVVSSIHSLSSTLTFLRRTIALTSAGASGLSSILAVLRGAFIGLWRVISNNPLGWVVTIASAVVSIFHVMGSEVDKLAQAMSELSSKHIREAQELQALRNALESTNTSYSVKAAALEKINSLYSKYLGFQISEIDSYEKKAAAMDLINEKMKEQQALEEKNRRMEYASEQFSDATKDDMRKLEDIFAKIPEIGRERWYEAMDVIQKATEDGVTNSIEMAQRLADYFEISVDKLRADGSKSDFRTAVMDYAREYSKYTQNIESIESAHNQRMVNLKAGEYETRKNLAEAHQRDIEAIELAHQKKVQDAEKEGRKISEQEQIAYLQALKRENEHYLETAKKMKEHWLEADAKKLKGSDVSNEDGTVVPSVVGSLYGQVAATEAKEYNDLLLKRNEIEQQYLATKAEVQVKEKELQEIENQRKENWDSVEEEDAYLESLNKAKEAVKEKKKLQDQLYKDMKATDRLADEQFAELSAKSASEARKEWTDVVEDIKAEIESLDVRIAGDPYGKGFNVKTWKDFGKVIENLDTSSVSALAAAYKKLREESATITADVEAFNKMFDPKTPKKNLDELNEQVIDWASQIRQRLASMGRGVTGEFLFGEGKKGYDEVMEQLKIHYLKQQRDLRASYLKGLMTGPELKRRLDENNKQLLNARVELNKLMLGQQNNFDQSLYPELAEANLAKIARTVFTAGEEVRTEIERNLEETQDMILEDAIKIRENLEKEFTKTSPFRTLDTQFRETLDNLGLMSSEFERKIVESLKVGSEEVDKFGNKIKHWDPFEVMGLDAQNMQLRFDAIKEFAEKSYTVDAEGLKELMKSHKDYDNWIKPMKIEQMEYLLQVSRWYYDQELLTVKKYTSDLKKEYDSMYNQLQLQMSDSERASWEIQQLSSLLLTDLEPGKLKAVKARLNELIKERDEARKREAEKAKSHRSKQEREAKEHMEASISALEAYFNEEEAMIRKKALENNWTQANLDRELLKNTERRERDLIQLRKRLLGKASDFNVYANEGYKGAITETVFFGDTRDLEKQAEQIKNYGSALMDGMHNQIAKGEITIQEALKKTKDRIDKILLEDNFTEKVAEQYLEVIDELGLLFNIETEKTDVSEEEGKRRLAYMQEWSKEAYKIDADGLKKIIESNELFAQWKVGRSMEEYEILLDQLRKYHDDQAEAEKKHADRMKKLTDARFKSIGQQSESEERIYNSEAKLKMAERLEKFGIGGEQVINDYEVELLNQKIAAEQQWLALLSEETIAKQNMIRQDINNAKRRLAFEQDEDKRREINEEILKLKQKLSTEQNAYVIASEESINKMLELQAAASEKYINKFTVFFDHLKGFQDGIDSFAQSMGEGIYGSKEDRQQAARDLLISVATTSKEMLQMWLTQLATRRLIDNMEVEQTRATEMRKQAIKLQSLVMDGTLAIGSLEAQEAIAKAENLLDSSRAIGKEVAKKGLIGLVIGAGISAALSALLGAAIGRVNKSKAEVTKATGANAGKLATGMLTYAEGNYPVLGNDGQVYNAKYEGDNIKTGIYRGGAHFGIFSEKKPEAIIDGDTTQRLIMNHPEIWRAIVTLSKTGRIGNSGMQTFASGNINDLAKQVAVQEQAQAQPSAEMMQMQATMVATQHALSQLTQVLAGGIHANINMYGDDGVYKSMKKAERFAVKRGYK